VAGAAGGVLGTQALLKDAAGRHEARVDEGVVAIARSEPGGGAAPSEATGAPIERGPETSPPSAPERMDSGAGPAEDDIAEEQALFDKGSNAYQHGSYAEAIKLLQAHAGKHPRGRYAEQREKLLTLALFRAGRASEARGRLAQLRRANPSSPLVRELDTELSTP
jgi:TolA-binding protein